MGGGWFKMTDVDTGEVILEGRTDKVTLFSEEDKYSIPCRKCGNDTGELGLKYEKGICKECKEKTTIRVTWDYLGIGKLKNPTPIVSIKCK